MENKTGITSYSWTVWVKVRTFWEAHLIWKNLPHVRNPYGFVIYLVNVKTMRTIAQIFVAFSEKLNFKELIFFRDEKKWVLTKCFVFFRRTSENRRTRSYQLFTHNRDNSTLSKDYGIGLRAFEDSCHIHIAKDLVRRNWSLLYLPDLWQILSCCYDPSKYFTWM